MVWLREELTGWATAQTNWDSVAATVKADASFSTEGKSCMAKKNESSQFEDKDEDENVDDGPESPKGITEEQVSRMIAGRLRKVEKMIEKQGSATFDMDHIEAMVSKILDEPDAPDAIADGDNSKVPAGVEAQLESLRKELERTRKKQADTETALSDKDSQMKLRERKAKIIKVLENAGAHNAEAAFRVLEPDLIEDSEIGDAFVVKLSGGIEDVVSPIDYIGGTFKEGNEWLFRSEDPGRRDGSSSSVSNSSGKRGRTAITAEDLADEGMSWDDYEKKRDQIHVDLEGQHRNG